jgi:hypothetical protein
MTGTGKESRENEMEYSRELCELKHEQLDKELILLNKKSESSEKTLRGGNGDGIGLIAMVSNHEKYIESQRDVLRKLNTKMWLVVLGFIGTIVLQLLKLSN